MTIEELFPDSKKIKEYLKQKFPNCTYKEIQIKAEKVEDEVCL